MNKHFPLSLIVTACACVAGCDRGDVEQAAAQAERRVEQAIPKVQDAALTTKVKAALIAAPDLSGVAIDVDTSGDVVTLTGTVQSAEQRQRAEAVARGVDGAKDVRNNLTVK